MLSPPVIIPSRQVFFFRFLNCCYYEVNEPRGEYVLIIAGRSREEMKKEEQAGWEALSLEEHMAHYESQGIDRKEAMKRVAKDRGVSKRDIYQALLK